MLNIFRQGGVTKTLMGGVVILIAAAFIFDSRGGSAVATTDCAVRVDQSCVPVKDYNFHMRLVSPAGATNKQLNKAGFSGHALNALVERELLLQEARRLGVAVSEDDVDKELATGRVHYSWPVESPVPMALLRGSPFPKTGAAEPISYIRVKNSKTGAFDYAIYKRQVRSLLRMSPKDFKTLQKDELTAARVRALVTSAVRVSEDEAFTQFDTMQSKATVRHVQAQTAWFARVGGDLSDAAAKAYDEKNEEAVSASWEKTKDRWKAGCPLVSEVLLRFPPGADAEERAAQNALATEAARLLKAGASFSVVAQAYSDAPSANVGGELGCLTDSYGAVGEDLLKAVKGLDKNEVSAAVETARGFHLLKFHGDLAEDEVASRGRLAVARSEMATADAQARAKQFLVEVIAAGKNGTALADVVEAQAKTAVVLDIPDSQREKVVTRLVELKTAPVVEISRTFTRNSTPAPGIKDRSAASEVFKLEKEDDFIETPLETFTGFAALQLKEKDLATREEFDEDKTELIRNLQEQKRADAISAYLTRLRARATKIELDQNLGRTKEPSKANPDADPDAKETNSG